LLILGCKITENFQNSKSFLGFLCAFDGVLSFYNKMMAVPSSTAIKIRMSVQ